MAPNPPPGAPRWLSSQSLGPTNRHPGCPRFKFGGARAIQTSIWPARDPLCPNLDALGPHFGCPGNEFTVPRAPVFQYCKPGPAECAKRLNPPRCLQLLRRARSPEGFCMLACPAGGGLRSRSLMSLLGCVLPKPRNLHPSIGFSRLLPENLRFTIAPVRSWCPARAPPGNAPGA